MDSLFQLAGTGIQTPENVYALGTLLRATPYNPLLYRDAIKARLQLIDLQQYTPDFAPVYTVGYHADGMILAFSGLQNFDQFASYLWNSSTCTMYRNSGRVVYFLRKCWEAIQANILEKIGAAPNSSRIVVCGYSCGGALAPIVANWLNGQFGAGRVKYVVSFGAPRPGDHAFAEGITAPQLTVENDGDPVPGYPRFNSFWSTVSTLGSSSLFQYNPGRPLVLSENGAMSGARSSRFSAADSEITFNTITSIGADPFGSVHGLKEYMRRLALNLNVRQENTRAEIMWRLNLAMDSNVSPVDYATPVTAPPTTAISVPPMPTVADVQRRPVASGAPGDPDVPVYDSTFVGESQRVQSTFAVSSGSAAGALPAFHGKDRHMLVNAGHALDLIRERDLLIWRAKHSDRTRRKRAVKLIKAALLYLGRIQARDQRNTDHPRSKSLSTNAYMIDPLDSDTNADLSTVMTALEDALTSVTGNTMVFDNGNSSLTLSLDNVRFLLSTLAYFGPLD